MAAEKLAERHVNQTLAVHKALALLRMYLVDPGLAPHAVEDAVQELEQAVAPIRQAPLPRVANQTKAEHTAEVARERRRSRE